MRDYLAARYDARFAIHPRVLEETVASVFRGLGHQTRVTAYTADGGIDVILDGPDDKTIGVQVKPSRNSIMVEAIRSLVGALIINGNTEGVFVTTSSFQSGCERAARLSGLKGYPIRLLDARSFYEALRIVQREHYRSKHDKTAPFSRADFLLVNDQSFRGP